MSIKVHLSFSGATFENFIVKFVYCGSLLYRWTSDKFFSLHLSKDKIW